MAILTTDGRSFTASTGTGTLADTISFTTPPAGSQDTVWVEVLNSNLISQGPIQFVNITAKLYYNAVGSWSMVVPYTDWLWNLIQAGDIIINVNWRGLFSFGGKCEKPGYQSSLPGAGAAQAGNFISLSGADYLALIANRVCYPNPGVSWASQSAATSDAVTAMKLETAIKHYVNFNIGPGALAARRMPLLTMATDQGRGPNVSYTVKFGTGVNLNLLDVIRALLAAGNTPMGVSVTINRQSHNLAFDVYIPRDLRNKAWFSEALGNLTAIDFSLTDPTCTDALVQGASAFVQISASATTTWNKTEQFIDSSSETDANNITATAQQAILTGAVGPTMNITAADIPFLTFGRDYGLGDIVSVEVQPGDVYADVVSGVTLTADPAQTPMIGAVPIIGQSSTATDTDQTIIGQLSARIRALEKKLATK